MSKAGKHNAKSKGSRIWGSTIRIRSHRYGTIKLRGLTLGDLEFIDELLEQDTNSRDFTIQLIHHQLFSPLLTIRDVQTWPEKLLTRVALLWAKHYETIEQHILVEGEVYSAFKLAVKQHRHERIQHLKKMLESMIDTSYISSVIASTDYLDRIIGSNALDFARSSHNAIAKLLNTSSPPSNIFERINTISPAWINHPLYTQTALKGLLESNSFIQSHLAEIAKMSALTESLVSNIQWKNIGSAILLPDYLSDTLKVNFLDFSKSYSNLYEFFRTSPQSVLSYSPELSKLPALEYFSEANLLELISDEGLDSTDSKEVQQLRDSVSAESDDMLPLLLQSIDPELVTLWQGAKYSLHSDNPDRIRHTATSLRELFTHVLHRLAPDEEVKKWSIKPEHYDDKKRPTRRARFLYICRGINNGPMSTFIEKDVNAALEFIQLFQRGTHEVIIPYSQAQLVALKVRMDGLIRFLIEVSRQNQ